MKEIIAIKPCPWCKKTPRFTMWLNKEIWLPHLECINSTCNVNPKSKYVPIRKRQKKSISIIEMKIKKCILNWNEFNPCEAYEALEFNFLEYGSLES